LWRSTWSRSLGFASYIQLFFFIMEDVCSGKTRVYPVDESHTYDEETKSCYFIGTLSDFHNTHLDCENVYGKLIVDNLHGSRFWLHRQGFYKVEGCIVVTSIRELKYFYDNGTIILPNPKFCEYEYSLLIYGNPNLKLLFLGEEKRNFENIFMRANRKLRSSRIRGFGSVWRKKLRSIDIGSHRDCTMEMAMKDVSCTTLVGDVVYQPENNTNKRVWSRVKKVHGTILINGVSEERLRLPKGLVIHGWARRVVRITNNHILRNIDVLLHIKVRGPEPWFWFRNNSKLCHTPNMKKKIEEKLMRKLEWNEDCYGMSTQYETTEDTTVTTLISTDSTSKSPLLTMGTKGNTEISAISGTKPTTKWYLIGEHEYIDTDYGTESNLTKIVPLVVISCLLLGSCAICFIVTLGLLSSRRTQKFSGIEHNYPANAELSVSTGRAQQAGEDTETARKKSKSKTGRVRYEKKPLRKRRRDYRGRRIKAKRRHSEDKSR
ncbi:hypothetical protein V3C99_000968, partial [Haemonchus contortus]|uniref:Recep_L_domain domain-containing protein n=1 Tax=Haemonchus contortus TaxID=6289 RepID=A0A7I4YG16_HAECO